MPPLANIRGIQDLWYVARRFKNQCEDIKKGKAFRFINYNQDYTGAQIALGFVLANPHISCAMIGTTRLAHLKELVKMQNQALPREIINKLRAVASS